MANPEITNSDTSGLMTFGGVFRDRTVTVAAGEVLARGTILGFDATNGNTVACVSDGTDGEDYPRFILMEALDNSAGATATDFANVQVCVAGEFDAANIVFDNGTDTLDTANTSDTIMRDALKTEGLIASPRSVEDELDNQ